MIVFPVLEVMEEKVTSEETHSFSLRVKEPPVCVPCDELLTIERAVEYWL